MIYIYVRLSLPGKPKKFISGLHQTALTSNSTTQQLPELGPKSPKSCQFALMIIILYIYEWFQTLLLFSIIYGNCGAEQVSKGSLLVGGLEHFLIFPYIGNVIIPTDELHHFFRGVGIPPTSIYIL